ncbi:MAG: hypothetical protein PUF38_03375, partial [Bacteroidales bacterium]|nr:hypothetical protein [Bacteroidales bacterium]
MAFNSPGTNHKAEGLRDKETSRVKETKRQRDKETKRQREEESKRQRVKGTKSQRDKKKKGQRQKLRKPLEEYGGCAAAVMLSFWSYKSKLLTPNRQHPRAFFQKAAILFKAINRNKPFNGSAMNSPPTPPYCGSVAAALHLMNSQCGSCREKVYGVFYKLRDKERSKENAYV